MGRGGIINALPILNMVKVVVEKELFLF